MKQNKLFILIIVLLLFVIYGDVKITFGANIGESYHYRYFKVFPGEIYTNISFFRLLSGGEFSYSHSHNLPKDLEIYEIDDPYHEYEGIGGEISWEAVETGHNEDFWLDERSDGCGGTCHDKLYYFFRADETVDSPAETNIMINLNCLENWSETENFIKCSVAHEEMWYEDDDYDVTYQGPSLPTKTRLLPADIDVFSFDVGQGVFCVETISRDSLPILLVISVYEENGNSLGSIINSNNVFNVYNANGQIDNKMQRCYFEANSKVYIEVKSSNPQKTLLYDIRVTRARPVILVHGIQCYPKTKDDLVDGNNSMGHWEDYLPLDSKCYPCVCYNFRWDSYTNDIYWNGKGIIKDIVECPPEQNPSVVKLEETHKMDVVLIAHSMGGYFVRYALEKEVGKIHKAITLGTPHYGSDIGLVPLYIAVPWFKETSKNNLTELRRGSELSWEMHKWGGKNKLVCFAGYDAPPRVPDWLTYTEGLALSDGVVPVSSAFVEGADNIEKIRADHGTIGLATYVSWDKYPLDTSPPGFAQTLKERISGNNKGQFRLTSLLIIGDSKYNKVYKKVRDYIKP